MEKVLMEKRCIIIADDLTGSADSGAQFAKFGFRTHIVSNDNFKDSEVFIPDVIDVLVVNTKSRDVDPLTSRSGIRKLIKKFKLPSFPIVYKKVDSSLRGNIGHEIDEILEKTKHKACFLAPAYPEQERLYENGVLKLFEKSMGFEGTAKSILKELNIIDMIQQQSKHSVKLIHLSDLSQETNQLTTKIKHYMANGNRIFLFDAISREDLRKIAKLAFRMESMPLLSGSAGLAEEIGRRLQNQEFKNLNPKEAIINGVFQSVFIISGSASKVAHTQLDKLKSDTPTFEINAQFFGNSEKKRKILRENLANRIKKQLSNGYAILKICQQNIDCNIDSKSGLSQLTEMLSEITFLTIKKINFDSENLLLILIGGETAQNILESLDYNRLEIIGEIFDSIILSKIIGGPFDRLNIITKAGGLGQDDALLKLTKMVRKFDYS